MTDHLAQIVLLCATVWLRKTKPLNTRFLLLELILKEERIISSMLVSYSDFR